jgi:hypothetical protein
MGAQTGSIAVATVTGGIVWLVLHLVILQEEETLSTIHGDAYKAYVQQVPRFVPRLSMWRDVEVIETRPSNTAKTFLEGSLMLLAIPGFALIEHSQSNGLLPVLLRLF